MQEQTPDTILEQQPAAAEPEAAAQQPAADTQQPAEAAAPAKEEAPAQPAEPAAVTVVDIRFRNNAKSYYFDPAGLTLQAGAHVIIDTARGDEFGLCAAGNHPVKPRELVLPLRRVLPNSSGFPLSKMLPPWMGSRPIRQRRNVVLPQPDGPRITATSLS